MKPFLPVIVLGAMALSGCGTTRWSDTQRTATEQLLISDAIDRAVSQIDFSAVAGKKIYLDTIAIRQNTDAAYLTSTLRQQLLASHCTLKDKADEADYVVEVRAGAVGTDRHDLLFGVPATKVPAAVPMPGVPTSIPEIPFATKTEQRAVAKIAVFAYNRRTGRAVWQSGVIPVESKVRDLWVLGAGPFQRGNIYEGTKFAGQKMQLPSIRSGGKGKGKEGKGDVVAVAQEAYFTEPDTEIAEDRSDAKKAAPVATASSVVPAGHAEPVGPPANDAAPTATPTPTPTPPAAKGPSVETRPRIPTLDFFELPMRAGKGATGGAK